ncbi:MAG: (E)-4-hydroxy-3-methylbut-2-enyl-diphosphate synthase [Candidatus Neomarinimicrobiota bacterium]|nr:(E)-4-hydroxy-3-methylbut-2-enyl-diphosphate synthase [Candidatus Neomarinimicrobiota bacterium]|tara:strand:+ start:29456 stop:31378 length:1923 start_codon:yes stop_codon:yes gene_type:complete
MKINPDDFCNSLTEFSRSETREVIVGDLGIGGNNPIRIQSMTTTDTMNTEETAEQSIRMIKAGSELVRITAPSKREAENLINIKNKIRNRGYNTPLVADIHFTPNAALIAAEIVEKVRINPGNYVDKKNFNFIEYNDESYGLELDRIKERFVPLVKVCKNNKTAMRIGTNHGSLSDRILSRYGDTPLGMVESALEFVRICEELDYHNLIISMKASNTQVMVQAYRLAVAMMKKEGMNYPLHLGVTEAGDGEDGRVKSSVGIGALLEDGIGDTVRVSLTEEPELELPVAKLLIDRYNNRYKHARIPPIVKPLFQPYSYSKRESLLKNNIGNDQVPRVIIDISKEDELTYEHLVNVGYTYSKKLDKWIIADQAVDYIFIGNNKLKFKLPGTLYVIQNIRFWEKNKQAFPLFTLKEYFKYKGKKGSINFVNISTTEFFSSNLLKLKKDDSIVLLINTMNDHWVADIRRIFLELEKINWKVPVIINKEYYSMTKDEFQLYSSTDIGSLLLDGFGDGIWLSSDFSYDIITKLSFGILQATRTRISKTEYISCPSCGRTLFDLQKVTSEIRSKTNHLKGVKIGIMGCIVNGPGEMADADYGYVGTGVGQISLYKGYEVVKKNIPADVAVQALIDLIKENGDWVDSN